MATLHIENVIRDFDSWKEVFERYDEFRARHGVRSYAVRRQVDDPNRILVDLEFDSVAEAEGFKDALVKVRATPLSQGQLESYSEPVVLEDALHSEVSSR
jgi:hypothetical protein